MEKDQKPLRFVAHVIIGVLTVSSALATSMVGTTLAARFYGEELELPQNLLSGMNVYVLCVVLVVLLLAFAGWYVYYYLGLKCIIGNYLRLVGSTLGVVVLAFALSYGLMQSHLRNQGVSTMQARFDAEYYEEDANLVGTLGAYVKQFAIDGEHKYYLCRQIDTFGPFAEPIFLDTTQQPFSQGYEAQQCVEKDGLTQVYLLSMQHYHDGYWCIVKRMVALDDMHMQWGSLSELEPYIVQMSYKCHRSSNEEQLSKEIFAVAGEVLRKQ